ncbi:r2r3-MYB transcription factor [Tritrichomonas foetus]|uniref:R2r3-MYB transcription factor n=1 Tax=Tritrichomonas foetus TaxID=1144522 RepID=A0A1J4JI15_9EUKA|nr:r2r3-MYB transcription factor [Tritrichomonas foetus]|eukprot:OHS97157.1 r2r3-MYB transcription factor [Tritrichomonas foetus]
MNLNLNKFTKEIKKRKKKKMEALKVIGKSPHTLICHILNYTNECTRKFDKNLYHILYNKLQQYLNNQVSRRDMKEFFESTVNTTEPLLELDKILRCEFESTPMNKTVCFNSFFDYNRTVPSGSVIVNEKSNGKRSTNRQWTVQEDRRLIYAMYKFGEQNWKAIVSFIGNDRTRAMCSQRWYRVINPLISKCSWSQNEDTKLLGLIHEHGMTNWVKISQNFENRSDVQCRYRYKQLSKVGDEVKNHKLALGSSNKFNEAEATSNEKNQISSSITNTLSQNLSSNVNSNYVNNLYFSTLHHFQNITNSNNVLPGSFLKNLSGIFNHTLPNTNFTNNFNMNFNMNSSTSITEQSIDVNVLPSNNILIKNERNTENINTTMQINTEMKNFLSFEGNEICDADLSEWGYLINY